MTSDAPVPLRLELPARRESLESVRQSVLGYLASAAPSAPLIYRVELVLEEIMMNIVWHAYPAEPGAMRVQAEVLPAEVRLIFEDEGIPFNPVTSPLRPLPKSLADAKPGGLGVRLVRDVAMDLSHERVGATNRLRVSLARFEG